MTVAVAVREESGALESASEPPLSVELVEGREAFNALEKEWNAALAPLPLSGPAGDRTGGRGRRGEEARQPQAPSRKPVRGRGIETGRQVPPEPPAPAAAAGRAGRGQLRPARWKGRKAARLRAG